MAKNSIGPDPNRIAAPSANGDSSRTVWTRSRSTSSSFRGSERGHLLSNASYDPKTVKNFATLRALMTRGWDSARVGCHY